MSARICESAAQAFDESRHGNVQIGGSSGCECVGNITLADDCTGEMVSFHRAGGSALRFPVAGNGREIRAMSSVPGSFVTLNARRLLGRCGSVPLAERA